MAGESGEQVTMAGSVHDERPHLAASRTKPSFHTPVRMNFSVFLPTIIEIRLTTNTVHESVAPRKCLPAKLKN